MAITTVPPLSDVPDFPAMSDRAAGTYNSKAYAFGAHMANTFNAEIAAVANNVHGNATEAAASAVTAVSARDDAAVLANAAAQSVVAAAEQADSAAASVTAAQAAAAAAGAAAGLPALAGAALRFLRVKSDETGVEFAAVDIPPQLVKSHRIFADGVSTLKPVSSGELIMSVEVNTGLAGAVQSLTRSNGLFIASSTGTGVATAVDPAGPWTVRTFPSTLQGSFHRLGSDGSGGLMVAGAGGGNVARSTDAISWTFTTLPTSAGNVAGSSPVGVNGAWVVQASNLTSFYRSFNGGASWVGVGIGTAPIENAIFRLGNDIAYFAGSNLCYSPAGTAAFAALAHGLGFAPERIMPLPDNTCAFVNGATGQVYLATAYNAIAPVPCVFCPEGFRPLRINGIWLFVGINRTSGLVYTATSRGLSSRIAAAQPYCGTVSSTAALFAAAAGVTVLPRAFGINVDASLNGKVILIDHATSDEALFAFGA